jgi:hypothetical protein
MKHKLLLIIMAALALSSGAAAQTTKNRNVSREAVRKAMQATRENKKNEEAQKEAAKTVEDANAKPSFSAIKAAADALKKKEEEDAKKAKEKENSTGNKGGRPSTSTNTNSGSNAGSRPSTSVNSSNASYIKEYLGSSEYRSQENAKALIKCTPESLKDLPKIIVNSEGAFVLENKKRDNSSNSEEFFGADPGVIFPGNLVYANTKLADGDPVPCNFAPGKVRLTINKSVPGGKSYADVTNDYAHVHQQIVDWIKMIGGTDASYTASGSTNYYSSSSHMAADLKVSASYLKNKAKVDMSTTTDELKIISVEDFSQNFYTVSASAINNDPTSLFGSDVTAAKIKSGVNSNGPIGIISSVTYGRRAYRFREFHSKDFTFKGDESVDVNAAGASVSLASTQNVTNSQKTSRFWAFVQSGNSDDKEIFYNNDANNGNSDFMKVVNKNSGYSAANIGVPKNFTVRFIGNSGVAKRAVTDVYYETEYVPCPKHISIEINKRASQVAQSSMQYKIQYKVIHLIKSKDRDGNTVYGYELWESPHNGKYAKDTDSGYADFTRKNFSQGEERVTRVLPTEDLTDHENCFVYGNLYWRLEGNHRSGQSWSKWDQGYLPVTSIPDDPSGSGKKAIIYINGSNYNSSNPYIHSESTGKSKK